MIRHPLMRQMPEQKNRPRMVGGNDKRRLSGSNCEAKFKAKPKTDRGGG